MVDSRMAAPDDLPAEASSGGRRSRRPGSGPPIHKNNSDYLANAPRSSRWPNSKLPRGGGPPTERSDGHSSVRIIDLQEDRFHGTAGEFASISVKYLLTIRGKNLKLGATTNT